MEGLASVWIVEDFLSIRREVADEGVTMSSKSF